MTLGRRPPRSPDFARRHPPSCLAHPQESLKQATAPLQASQALPGAIDLRGGPPPAQEHRSALLEVARAALARAPPPSLAPVARPLLALAFLSLVKGVPAPYAGVHAPSPAEAASF